MDPALQFKKDIEFLINAPEFHENLDLEERQSCLRHRTKAREMAQFIFEYRVERRTDELIAMEMLEKHNWQGEGF